MSTPRSEAVAHAMRTIGGTLCRRASFELPGLAEVFEHRVVVVLDGSCLTGPLGSLHAPGWEVDGRRFDMLTLNVRHPGLQSPNPLAYAEGLLTVYLHELAHVAAHVAELPATRGPDHRFHTEEFARIARRIGLRVSRRPDNPAGLFTPGLTPAARDRHGDLISLVARLDLRRLQGRALAGPPGFTGTLPPVPPSIFTSALRPSTASSFLR